MKMQTVLLLLTSALAAVLVLSVPSKQISKPQAPSRHFTGLGELPGGFAFSSADVVSADGLTVVGYSHSEAGIEAFRWSQKTGIVGLGFTRAVAVSADGSEIVGYQNVDGQNLPVRWTVEHGIEVLGERRSVHHGVSADSIMIVDGTDVFQFGTCRGNNAFLWRTFSKTTQRVHPKVDKRHFEARSISANGAVVVGVTRFPIGHNIAFRWTPIAGPIELGTLPGHSTSEANAVSLDGSVIVGCSSDFISTQAFRWTKDTGMVPITNMQSPGRDSWACGVSADGSLIVGTHYTISGPEAFVWDATHGMRTVRQVLTSDYHHCDTFRDWILRSATAVSADGKVIIGYGLNPDGDQEAWIARLTPILGGNDLDRASRNLDSTPAKLSSSSGRERQR